MRSRRVAVIQPRRFAAGLALAAGLWPAAPRAQSVTSGVEPRLVTAVGRADTEAAPDRAVVLLTVRANGKSAAEAAQGAARRSASVLEALRGRLGPGERAETAANSVQPAYAYEQGKPPRITGYQAEHQLRARTAKLAEIGALLDAATASADVSVDSVRFELSDPATAQANALRLAAQDARTRAAAVADGLGLALGPVRSARELGAPQATPMADYRMKAAAAPAATEVVTPQLVIHGEVEVSFELSTGPRS
jgi:hypothetical protein